MGSGTYSLEALSSNPMWRVRAGAKAEIEKGDPPIPLVSGDVILLFTGAEDCTPDGPGNLGTLFWTFQDRLGSRDAGGDGRELDSETIRRVPRTNSKEVARTGTGPNHFRERGCLNNAFQLLG